MTAVEVARRAIAIAAGLRITLTTDALCLELVIPRKDPNA